MAIEIKMPALSPTMEEGTLAKWIIAEGDSVRSGDLMAEIETDKATMEFEAVDEGVVSRILVAAGTDNVKVGTVIALLTVDGEPEEDGAESAGPAATDTAPVGAGAPESDAPLAAAEARDDHGGPEIAKAPVPEPAGSPPAEGGAGPVPVAADRNPEPAARIKASPLARRIAGTMKVDLAGVPGSGPGGRIVRADVEAAGRRPAASTTAPASGASREPVPAGLAMPPGAPGATPAPGPTIAIPDIPHRATKLSNVRKVIARRLTESKASVPHIYLTVDIELDALLALRTGLNEVLARRDIKLSVNDLLIKALACALIEVPTCNVMYTPDQLISFSRADISVAVSAPSGLITPIITAADTKPAAVISSEMKELAGRAREGKLAPHEYQGGTASLSNMGMFGIRAFDAVINPPQAMIMAIGAGEQRAWVSKGVLGIATIMSATGSFDHRAVDGADGAALMQAFRRIVEQPLGLLA